MAEMETNNDVLAELANTSLGHAGISEFNFESGYEAEITETEKLPIVTLEYANGLKDVPHNMAFAPTPDSLATRRAVLDILGEIDLQQLCINLEATAALMDIAYNACNSIVGAHAKMYELRSDIYKTTVKSVNLSNEFSVASRSILGVLVKVYKYIASGDSMNLSQVSAYLSRISNYAKEMSEEAESMAKDFTSLSKRTFAQGAEVVKVKDQNIQLKNDMELQIREFKAKLDGFNASKQEIENEIEELQTLFTKYDNEARELNKKADRFEMAGMFFDSMCAMASAVGTAVSGFYDSNGPKVKTVRGKESVNTSDNENEDEKMPELEQSADVLERQARLGSNKAQLEIIEISLKTYDQKIENLEKEKSSTEKKRTDEEIDKEIEDIKKQRDEDSKQKEELTKLIAEDDAYLKAKLASQAGISVEEASKKFGEKFDNSSANARSAAIAKQKSAEEIFKLKLKLQNKNSENEAMIAEFTTKIKNMNLSSVDLSVAITSLQLAVTCLSTVGSILANVAIFWNRVELSLKNLAGDAMLTSLQNMLQDSKDNPNKVANYAKTDEDFIGDWYIMESKWFAMQLVCEAYHRSCVNAKDRMDISLTRAETDGLEHWKLAQSMAAEMEEKLKIRIRSSESKTEDFKNKIRIMEKTREDAYKELL